MMFLRRGMALAPNFVSGYRSFRSKVPEPVFFELSPLLCNDKARPAISGIEVMDDESWRLSSGLGQVWREENNIPCWKDEVVGLVERRSFIVEKDPDFNDLDSMRLRGDLFFQIIPKSKEYEDHIFEYFHKHKRRMNLRGRHKGKAKNNHRNPCPKEQESSEQLENEQSNDGPLRSSSSENENLSKEAERKFDSMYMVEEIERDLVPKKRKRKLCFSERTEIYHNPFCLDVQISRASVRACVIHKVTSKVVAVAHSLSKDFKSELSSLKDNKACVAVGATLARRALADDIHNLVYTPRDGDELEGKIRIMVQAIIENGVDINVKMKQINVKIKKLPIDTFNNSRVRR